MVEEISLFDNDYYYSLYPDVGEAVKNKVFKNGYEHFLKYGRKEGRLSRFIETEHKIDEVNANWSNHLTLKGYKEPDRKEIILNMADVPQEFKPVQSVEYPSGNKEPFERYFESKFKELKPYTYREYLPIHWTAYYVNNAYGTNKQALETLQIFIDSLDKTKKYFTIIQYDDGILNDISGLDILVYSMGCKKAGYYPLPLISQPLNNSVSERCEKELMFSFFGANTHPLRETMVKELNSEFVKLETQSTQEYYKTLSKSIFALCPRGYGITSFRMFEAMHFNCIPVYVSDDFWEPLNLPFEYGIKIRPYQITDIPAILSKVNIKELQDKVKFYYENYFVYSSCFASIIKTLSI